MSSTSFSQTGVIDSIIENTVLVRIECYSACASCHAKDGCLSTDKKDRLIEVALKGRNFKTGQPVTVSTHKSNAYTAVFFAYLLPFILLISSLFFFLSIFSETIAGLLCLMTLVPYYFILYLLRKRFSNRFEFEIN